MRNILSLARSLLRGGGRRTVLDLSLTVVGVAIPVAVILLVVGTVTGFSEREDAMAWREPTPVEAGEATALQRRSYQPWKGQRVEVVELAAIADAPPIPPGMASFPAPGEVWVSPGLADRLADTSDRALFEQRVGGSIAGILEADALAYPEELVAVVGDGELEATPLEKQLPYDHRFGGGFLPSDVLYVNGFAESGRDPGLPYQYMVAASIAGALLVAPSITLLGAGARLTAARRGRRLAALRLAGATAGQVTALAALETAFGAALGIALGATVWLAGTAVVVTGVPLGGGHFTVADLVPGPGTLFVILAGALIVAVLSALAGLRQVRATPLGVARQGGARRPGFRRFGIMVVAWLAFIAAVALARGSGAHWMLVGGLGVVILSISTVGPVFAWIMGWATVRLSRRPRALVAGRRLMADPVGSFRPTAGLVLVSFVAGFLLLSNATLPEAGAGDNHLVLDPFTSFDGDLKQSWQEEVAAVYPEASFSRAESGGLAVSLPSGVSVEESRNRIQEITGIVPLTEEEIRYESTLFADDVRRALWVVVSIALIQAAFATGVGAAASVLEQGNTLAALSLAGTPMSQLQGARALQGAIPITVSSAVFVALGALAGGMTIVAVRPDVAPVVPSLLQAGLVVVAAAGAAVAGTGLSRPVLRSVLARPLAER